MKKNAFTLIELLAVIVILAIVALIATPIILGIIRDAKENANKRSIEMYADAIKNALVRYQLKENKKTTTFEQIEEYIEYDGNVACDIIQIYEDGNIYLNGCIINNDNSRGYIYGEQHLASENVRAVTESKTAKIPEINEDGDIVVGSEFKIKVSNNIKDENGDIVEYTFFVLSNEGEYVNLIAEQNITPDGEFTSEPQDGDEWYVTTRDNRYGPQTAYNYLSTATSNWTNIPIIENFYYEDDGHKSSPITVGYENIKTTLDNSSGKYITTITPLTDKPVTYENMRVRLSYVSEVTKNTTCNSEGGSCPLWMVNYLYSGSISEKYYNETNGKVNSIGINNGYYLLTSHLYASMYAEHVHYQGVISEYYTNDAYIGLRPVITILKSDLLRVMK